MTTVNCTDIKLTSMKENILHRRIMSKEDITVTPPSEPASAMSETSLQASGESDFLFVGSVGRKYQEVGYQKTKKNQRSKDQGRGLSTNLRRVRPRDCSTSLNRDE